MVSRLPNCRNGGGNTRAVKTTPHIKLGKRANLVLSTVKLLHRMGTCACKINPGRIKEDKEINKLLAAYVCKCKRAAQHCPLLHSGSNGLIKRRKQQQERSLEQRETGSWWCDTQRNAHARVLWQMERHAIHNPLPLIYTFPYGTHTLRLFFLLVRFPQMTGL